MLSKAEIDYVIAELAKSGKSSWSRGMLKNSRLVSKTEIDSIFLGKDKGWPYFNAHYGDVLYSFSKPIFLRKRTFCIFYSSSSSGNLSGGGGFSIYANDNGTWRLYRILTMWVS